MTADKLLRAAGEHMKNRGATYDSPGGERSMSATVEAFNAITGANLTETEGWMFMVLLKLVRNRQRAGGHRDSLEDAVAYAALMGEAALAVPEGEG